VAPVTASTALTVDQSDAVTVVVMDDGKANALNHELIDGLRAALRDAEANSRALVLAGRPGRFSAGFDLSVMTAGPDAAMPLLQAGADLAIDIYMSRVPVVLGVTGHALAMGAILLLAADVRVGTAGEFKIGMNEVAIGMPVPRFATELARDRLSKLHFVPAIQHAHIYDPASAVEAGYLDQVAADGEAINAAVAHASMLADSLRQGAFQLTRDIARGPVADALRAGIAADMAEAGFGNPL
jgi:enoyl-CoA hydratase